MTFLLTNDDGITSQGLSALEKAASGFGSTITVAPEKEQSATSHRFTLHKPLRAKVAGERRFSVSGSPADCCYMGLHHFVDAGIRMVLSGVNRGPNLGNDVFYSGTAAGAREACFNGIPSVAFSLNVKGSDPVQHWDTAGFAVRWLIERVLRHGLPRNTYLNVNIPNIEESEIGGFKATALGNRSYHKTVDRRVDWRGEEYFWIGGAVEDVPLEEGTDVWALANRYVSITPISLKITDSEVLHEISRW